MTSTPSQPGAGKAFFDRADSVADTGNWDFAIELYLEGIQREPDALDRGHKKLRDVALRRKAGGGKGPGMMEQLKHRGGKDAIARLVNVEYLLAKDPGSETLMQAVLKSSSELNQVELKKWICGILLESQRQAAKPDRGILRSLLASFKEVEDFTRALEVCRMAIAAAPSDSALQEELKDLSARYTIAKGKYDQEGDFQRSVKDAGKQKELLEHDSMVKSGSYLEQQIVRAREEYQADPAVAGKINGLVDALLKLEDAPHEQEAIDVLTQAYAQTSNYAFKLRLGDIRIKQMTRRYRQFVDSGDTQAAKQHAREQLAFELTEYAERAKNYPTDLGIKYELGRRQFLSGNYDEAIGPLQDAQRDPRRRLHAISYLGQSFAKKGWFQEAVDTFTRALEGEVPEERQKELRYHLGDALEQMGRLADAQKQYSQVAQMDFNYRDVRKRMDAGREKLKKQEPPPQSS